MRKIRLPATTPLPATLIEAEALQFARDQIASLREPNPAEWGIFGGVAFFGGGTDAHAFARRVIKSYATDHAFNMTAVIDAARNGDADCQLAVRELIVEARAAADGGRIDHQLENYNTELLHPRPPVRRRRSRDKTTNFLQDLAICSVILELSRRFGLKPTRSGLQRSRPSGCSVVAKELASAGLHRGEEKAIEVVWNRYAPSLR